MIEVKQISPPRKLPGLSSFITQFNYNENYVNFIHQVPNSIWDKKSSTWEFPLTSLSKFIELFSQSDDLSIDTLPDEIQESDKIYNLQNYKTPPFEYQKEGIQYGLNHDKFLLLDAPGLGKSLQMIYLAQELKEKENLQHCLIICGINTLKTNWKREIEKHSNLSCKILGERINKKGKIVYGGVKDRLSDLQNPISEFFVITNIETLRSDEVVKAINSGKNKFDMIIVDEIHKAKDSQSQQGKGLLKLKSAKHKVALTGTLILNSPMDCFVPLKFIEKDNSTLTNYKYYYCTFGGPFNNMLVGFKNMKILKDQIDKFSLRRTKDLLDLPEKTIIDEFIDMDDSQQVFYDNIKDGIISQVDKVKMSTSSLLALVTRLRQATACPSILTSENISSAKIDRACELADQILSDGNNKLIIFSTFKGTAMELYNRLHNYNPLICTGDISDDIVSQNVEQFQSTADNKILIATWQKMGTGLTLTAASYAIFIDTPYTWGVYEQAQDRIHRIGARNPVFIYNLICNNTIDERVHEIVTDKKAIGDYVVDDQISQSGIQSLRKYIEELQ